MKSFVFTILSLFPLSEDIETQFARKIFYELQENNKFLDSNLLLDKSTLSKGELQLIVEFSKEYSSETVPSISIVITSDAIFKGLQYIAVRKNNLLFLTGYINYQENNIDKALFILAAEINGEWQLLSIEESDILSFKR